MKRNVYECAFCAAMTTGYGIGAMAITVLAILGIIR